MNVTCSRTRQYAQHKQCTRQQQRHLCSLLLRSSNSLMFPQVVVLVSLCTMHDVIYPRRLVGKFAHVSLPTQRTRAVTIYGERGAENQK